ncbi:hypothetical protein [Xenorhabdus szentirmaii]|uniref:hypothetical protein n=1 Tax=Xenorhabdus szentirmaii TaxID=290112 RepID=UPI000C04728C|nr:hypothetical protein [Xenorhabdus szentirmaii]PHM42170.1 hypothetical protein Xszus_01900 [Xenorhabdus szentirmaii]
MRLDENKKNMDYEDVRNRIKECERYITSLKEELNEREVDSIGFDYFDKDLDIRIKEAEVTLIELK